MRALLSCAVVALMLACSLAQGVPEGSDLDVLYELCVEWRSTSFNDWPEDCNSSTACLDSGITWTGIECQENNVAAMYVFCTYNYMFFSQADGSRSMIGGNSTFLIIFDLIR